MRRATAILAVTIVAELALHAWAQTAPLPSSTSLDEEQKIDLLLKMVRDFPGEFVRSGTAHSGSDAADHLSSKRAYAGNRVKNARQFIDDIASASSISGEVYHVRTPDGVLFEARPWLHGALTMLEALEGDSSVPERAVGHRREDKPTGADVLEIVAASKGRFLRIEHDETEVRSGRDMARYLAAKALLNGGLGLPANEFIDRCCTSSILHGTPYRVEFENGGSKALGDWLTEQIRGKAGDSMDGSAHEELLPAGAGAVQSESP